MLQIVLLSREHNRREFDCGVPELDAFLKAVALQHAGKGISRTLVLTASDQPDVILGFFTLTLCEAKAEQLPEAYSRRFPGHALPAVRLARLTVARSRRKEGYGRLLLGEAIHRTLLISDQAGLIGLFADAKDAGARSFYERFGFVPLRDYPLRLFLPRETLLAARPESWEGSTPSRMR